MTTDPGVERCPTRLLPDSPADDDHFGPHDRIASAIVDIVADESGGRTIALAGDYGSGKSTVIRLLKKKLSDSKSHAVWVFDTWAHEGDPLRRTFLESLISYLIEKEWVDRGSWQKRLRRLAFRRKQIATKTVPRLSLLGALLAFGLLVAPLGLALLNDALEDNLQLWRPWQGGSLHITGTIGVVLALIPVLVAGCAVALAVSRNKKGAEAEDAAAELGAILIQNGSTESKTETAESPEPTSLEFEKMFRCLMREALAKTERRLVLVIDNLDRVEPADALTIWSTLRAFLDHSAASQNEEWIQRIWIILPYDRGGIARLWSRRTDAAAHGRGPAARDYEAGRPEETPTATVADQAAGTDERLAASFLDKSIQLRFDVPPPLLADWREYVLGLLREALPNHRRDEFHTIYRLIALRHGGPGDTPTPRRLKAIVNQLGALHRQWQDDLELAHLAYYALLDQPGRQVIESVLDGSLPEAKVAGLLGPGVRESLAALAFGTDVATAQQLLLAAPIEEALAQAETSRLLEMARRFPYFWPVLEQVLQKASQNWAPAESEKLLCAAAALDESGLLANIEEHERSTAIRQLTSAAFRAGSLVPATDCAVKGLIILACWENTIPFAKRLLGSISSGIASRNIIESDGGLRTFADACVKIQRALAEHGLGEASKAGITIPGGMDGFARVVRALYEAGADHHEACIARPSARPDEIVKYFKGVISKRQFGIAHADAVSVATKVVEADWGALAEALADRLNAQNGASVSEVEALLYALIAIGAPADSHLVRLATEGHLAHQFHAAAAAQEPYAKARLMAAQMSVMPTLRPSGQIGNSSQGQAVLLQEAADPPAGLAEAIAEIIMTEMPAGVERLFQVLDSQPNAGLLVVQILAIIAANPQFDACFPPEAIIGHWAVLSKRVDMRALLAREPLGQELSLRIQEGGFDPTRASLYELLARLRSEDASLRSWCAEGLRALDAAMWTKALKARPPEVLQLAFSVQELGTRVDLGQPFREALLAHAEAAMKKGTELPEGVSGAMLTELLQPAQCAVLRDQILEKLEEARGVAQPAFFEGFGSELAQASRLRERSGVVTEVVEPILERRELAALRWLRDLLRQDGGVFDALGSHYRQLVEGRIEEALSEEREEEAEARAIIEEIAAILGVQRKRQPK